MANIAPESARTQASGNHDLVSARSFRGPLPAVGGIPFMRLIDGARAARMTKKRAGLVLLATIAAGATACRSGSEADPTLQRDVSAAVGRDSASDLELAPRGSAETQVVSAIEAGPAEAPHAPLRVRKPASKPARQIVTPNVRRPERVAEAPASAATTTAAVTPRPAPTAKPEKTTKSGEFVDPVVAPLPASSVSRGTGASLGQVLSRLPGRINP